MARTRSAAAHRKVLDAAIALVAEHGVDATSMDAIARRSGVSKATIYKHWPDKDALLLEMLKEMYGIRSRPSFDTGNTRADMAAVLAYRAREDRVLKDRILPHFAAYAARNIHFGMAWRKMVMEPPQRELIRLLKSGVEKKELSPAAASPFSMALLLGPVIYWHMFQPRHEEELAAISETVVDTFWAAYGLKKSAARPPLPRRSAGKPPLAKPAAAYSGAASAQSLHGGSG
jgi:AcrR family transcriptional regulator